MSTINGNVCVADGVAVDKVFSNGKQVYGRNMVTDSGFESGNTPSGIFWGMQDNGTRKAAVISSGPNHPTPFGKYMLDIEHYSADPTVSLDQFVNYPITPVLIKKGETWKYSYYYASTGSATGQASDYLMDNKFSPVFGLSMGHDLRETSGGQQTWQRFVKTWTADIDVTVANLRFGFVKTSHDAAAWICIDNIKLEKSTTATPWTPAPEDVLK